MRRQKSAAVGAIGFAVLSLAAFSLAQPPGGTYKASDVAKYVAHGHRPAVFVSGYVMLLAVIGLVSVITALRGLLPAGWSQSTFQAIGLIAAGSLLVGFALVGTVPTALAVGGGSPIDPRLTYMFTEAGDAVMFGAAFVVLGATLVLLGVRAAMPVWLRVVTVIAGVGGLAAPAFFPMFLVLIWALVVGVWLLANPQEESAPATAAAAAAA
jgi:hypothetical protein